MGLRSGGELQGVITLQEIPGWKNLSPLQKQVIACACLSEDGQAIVGPEVAKRVEVSFIQAGIPTPLDYVKKLAHEEGDQTSCPVLKLSPHAVRAV